MDYVKPGDVVGLALDSAHMRSRLAPRDLVIRGALAGGLLGFATAVAMLATVQTGMPLVGALVFPAGFAIVVLLGLELLTGSFALLPIGMHASRLNARTMLANWCWVLLGNLLGSVLFGAMLCGALTMSGTGVDASGLANKLVAVASAKTLAYSHAGLAGQATAFIKAILCNWMVCIGVVLAMASRSTAGKILAAWLPICMFFYLGFEHTVVNMFVIPTAMLLGAKISIGQWLVWNFIPVTLGNLVGGYVFTGLALYLTHGAKSGAADNVLSAASALIAEPYPATTETTIR